MVGNSLKVKGVRASVNEAARKSARMGQILTMIKNGEKRYIFDLTNTKIDKSTMLSERR
ncbi:hypothetical protein [Paraburkholderia aspalathi]|uniref:hypothetical protein n=1 Tax=Paraburkholderia aspalathi TaxID=1324617 RepID=UPI0038BB3B59